MIGVLAILWLGISVYFMSRIFDVQRPVYIFLLAGIMIVNRTLISLTATYLFELDVDMLSVLFSCIAVYLWKSKRFGFFWGSFFIIGTLGIYQCNISIAITLIIFCSILDILFDYTPILRVIYKGALGIVMLLIGSLLYWVVLKICLFVTGISLSQGYNSITNMFSHKNDLIHLIIETYKSVFNLFLNPISTYPRPALVFILVLAVLATLLLVIKNILSQNLKVDRILLVITLTILLPIGSNTAYILNNGEVHDLMNYASWMYLAFPFLLISKHDSLDPIGKNCFEKVILSIITVVFLWNNILTANSMYLKKDWSRKLLFH